MARFQAASGSLPTHHSREFEAPERSVSRDESCRLSLTGPRPIRFQPVPLSSVSAGPAQWLWRFSATSFPLRIRKSGWRVRFRLPDLPLARPLLRCAYPSAYPAGPSDRKLNPLCASSNCRLLTPKSASNPSKLPGAIAPPTPRTPATGRPPPASRRPARP